MAHAKTHSMIKTQCDVTGSAGVREHKTAIDHSPRLCGSRSHSLMPCDVARRAGMKKEQKNAIDDSRVPATVNTPTTPSAGGSSREYRRGRRELGHDGGTTANDTAGRLLAGPPRVTKTRLQMAHSGAASPSIGPDPHEARCSTVGLLAGKPDPEQGLTKGLIPNYPSESHHMQPGHRWPQDAEVRNRTAAAAQQLVDHQNQQHYDPEFASGG